MIMSKRDILPVVDEILGFCCDLKREWQGIDIQAAELWSYNDCYDDGYQNEYWSTMYDYHRPVPVAVVFTTNNEMIALRDIMPVNTGTTNVRYTIALWIHRRFSYRRLNDLGPVMVEIMTTDEYNARCGEPYNRALELHRHEIQLVEMFDNAVRLALYNMGNDTDCQTIGLHDDRYFGWLKPADDIFWQIICPVITNHIAESLWSHPYARAYVQEYAERNCWDDTDRQEWYEENYMVDDDHMPPMPPLLKTADTLSKDGFIQFLTGDLTGNVVPSWNCPGHRAILSRMEENQRLRKLPDRRCARKWAYWPSR